MSKAKPVCLTMYKGEWTIAWSMYYSNAVDPQPSQAVSRVWRYTINRAKSSGDLPCRYYSTYL